MSPPLDVSDARRQTLALLDAGRPEEALRAAEQLSAEDPNVAQVLAFAEIEGGEQLADPDIVRRGVGRLAGLEERVGVSMAYNRANGHFALWTLAVRHGGVARAHTEHRTDLHAARDAYAIAGADEDLDEQMRCQALVNLGNSFDNCGRHADALVAYSQALTIRSGFTMALGNRGTTLLHRAAQEDVHQHALVSEAVAALDAALADPDDVVAHGDPAALASFQAERARIPGTPTHDHDQEPLADPYLEWCRRRGLFLHPSPRCITRETHVLDRLPLGGMTVKVDERSQQRLKTLRDSLNSLLQDYLAVRYLAWSVLEPETPLREHAAVVSAHASFYDSLTYARWGVGTGLRVAAVAAAMNLLDKTGGVAHQYLRTGQQPRQAYFRRFGLLPTKKHQPDRLHAAFAAELDREAGRSARLSRIEGARVPHDWRLFEDRPARVHGIVQWGTEHTVGQIDREFGPQLVRVVLKYQIRPLAGGDQIEAQRPREVHTRRSDALERRIAAQEWQVEHHPYNDVVGRQLWCRLSHAVPRARSMTTRGSEQSA